MHISLKRVRRTQISFDFVRYRRLEDAVKIITMFNNYIVRRNRIKVTKARFQK